MGSRQAMDLYTVCKGVDGHDMIMQQRTNSGYYTSTTSKCQRHLAS